MICRWAQHHSEGKDGEAEAQQAQQVQQVQPASEVQEQAKHEGAGERQPAEAAALQQGWWRHDSTIPCGIVELIPRLHSAAQQGSAPIQASFNHLPKDALIKLRCAPQLLSGGGVGGTECRKQMQACGVGRELEGVCQQCHLSCLQSHTRAHVALVSPSHPATQPPSHPATQPPTTHTSLLPL
jgi:hypothetical protein